MSIPGYETAASCGAQCAALRREIDVLEGRGDFPEQLAAARAQLEAFEKELQRLEVEGDGVAPVPDNWFRDPGGRGWVGRP